MVFVPAYAPLRSGAREIPIIIIIIMIFIIIITIIIIIPSANTRQAIL
jgi:hypothetical protein